MRGASEHGASGHGRAGTSGYNRSAAQPVCDLAPGGFRSIPRPRHAPPPRRTVRAEQEAGIPLRAESDAPDARGAAGAVSLSAGAPFDLLKSLTCLDLLGLHVAPERVQSASLRVPLDVGGRTALFHVAQAGAPDRPRLVATPLAGGGVATEDERRRVARQLEHLLGPSDDPAPFYDVARDDPPFWRLAHTLEGLHRIGFATPFEGICWTILRQRQYPNVARARLRRLRQRFGRPVDADGETHWAFPEPAAVAGAAIEAIRREVKSRTRARYLREAATAFAALGDELDVLHAPPDALETRLMGIRGVGPWSARTFLGRAFSRPHVGHVVSEGVVTPYWRDVLGRFYGTGVDPALVRERADAYGRWEGYWLFYAGFVHTVMQRAARAEVVEA